MGACSSKMAKVEATTPQENKEETKEINNTEWKVNETHIGSDEVGTGDFFGGIVVAASYIPIESIPYIRRLGVKDSKELTDSKIQEIAPILMEKVKYSVLLLDNMKYNYVTKVKNMNIPPLW